MADPGAIVALAILVLVGVAMVTLLVLQRLGGPPAPSRSPAPWIADEVWSARGRHLGRLVPVGGVIAPELLAVSEADRARAPRAPLPPRAEAPPPGPMHEQRDRLLATPGPTRVRMPVWPLCCERLTTLVAHRPTADELARLEQAAAAPLDQAYLEAELVSWGGPAADRSGILARGWSEVLGALRAGRHDGEGLAVYQCRGCGRLYVASCGPSS